MGIYVSNRHVIVYGGVQVYNKPNAKKKYYPNQIIMDTFERQTYIDSILERVFIQDYYL